MNDNSTTKANKESSTSNRYLNFTLNQLSYAIPLLSVREVIAVPALTPIPSTPPHFSGIMNLRGEIISVIDLRKKLGFNSVKTGHEAVIICDLATHSVGVIVDSVNSVVSPSQSELSPRPDAGFSGAAADYITSIYRRNDQLVLIIDLNGVLDAGDRQIVQQQSQGKK